MRLNTLGNVRVMLKMELGQANVTNAVEDLVLNQLIDHKQQWLAGEYDWPFLQHRWDLNLGPQARFAAFPANTAEGTAYTMNFDRPFSVDVFYNQKYEEVKYGIGAEEYNIWNPVLQQSNDPVQRWQFFDQGQVEVWPMTAGAQTVRWTGQRYAASLLTANAYDDTKLLDLDDLLVVYFCAAERLARADQADAKIKLELGNERLLKVRANFQERSQRVILGNDEEDRKQLMRVVPIIGVHG